MKVDFNYEFKNIDGSVIKETAHDGTKKPLNLKDVCASALANSTDGDGLEKAKAYDLAMKIISAKKPIDITAEDIVLIKKRIEPYAAVIYGQAVRILEAS